VDTDKAQEFDGWCFDEDTASWARSMTQETNLVRVPEAHIDELVQCAKLGNAKRARELITEITATGGIPDQFAWSALLSACAKGDLSSMRAVMREMDQLGVAPNAHGFNAIAGAFSRAGQAENIRKMLPQMKEAGVEPNVYIFTSLVAAYGKSGRPVDASRVLSGMCAAGVQPNVATYNALISAWCKGSSEQTLPAHTALRQADNVLMQMEQAGAWPDTFTYTALMAGHLQTGNPHAALAVMSKMEAAGLQPDQASDAVKQAVHQALLQQDTLPKLKRSKSGSEHKRSRGPQIQAYKGSRAATGNERSQLVSQWRTQPCKDSREPHETQTCLKKTTEECGNWRRTGECQYGIKCRYVHNTPQSKLIRTRTFPATKSCWRGPAEVAQVAQPAANAADWTTTLKTMLGVEPTADATGSIQPPVGSFQNGKFVCAVQGPQEALEVPQAQMQKTTSSSKSVLDCVSCPTCGNSFAAKDAASFQQHQKRCANKRNKKSKCKLGKSNNGWTKAKSSNRSPPPAAAVA
jgi:pentatricopeptide repeat protein